MPTLTRSFLESNNFFPVETLQLQQAQGLQHLLTPKWRWQWQEIICALWLNERLAVLYLNYNPDRFTDKTHQTNTKIQNGGRQITK